MLHALKIATFVVVGSVLFCLLMSNLSLQRVDQCQHAGLTRTQCWALEKGVPKATPEPKLWKTCQHVGMSRTQCWAIEGAHK